MSNISPQGHFRNRCAVSPVHSWRFKSLCLYPTERISARSNLSDRAMPENRTRCVSIGTPAIRVRNRRGPPRRSRRCRTDIRPDRSRSTIPTDQFRAGCRRLLGNRTGVDMAVYAACPRWSARSRLTSGLIRTMMIGGKNAGRVGRRGRWRSMMIYSWPFNAPYDSPRQSNRKQTTRRNDWPPTEQ
jgi:hypothetical protein